MNALKISRVPLGECVARTNANQTTGMSTRIARRTRREWLFLPLIAGALSGCALVKPAAKAAKLAAPEYAAAIDAVANRLTEKSVDATLEGWEVGRTYYYKDMVISLADVTYRDRADRTGTLADGVPPPLPVATRAAETELMKAAKENIKRAAKAAGE